MLTTTWSRRLERKAAPRRAARAGSGPGTSSRAASRGRTSCRRPASPPWRDADRKMLPASRVSRVDVGASGGCAAGPRFDFELESTRAADGETARASTARAPRTRGKRDRADGDEDSVRQRLDASSFRSWCRGVVDAPSERSSGGASSGGFSSRDVLLERALPARRCRG